MFTRYKDGKWEVVDDIGRFVYAKLDDRLDAEKDLAKLQARVALAAGKKLTSEQQALIDEDPLFDFSEWLPKPKSKIVLS